MGFHGATLEVVKSGMEMILEKGRPGDLEGWLFLFLRDFRASTQRSYVESLQRRHLSVKRENIIYEIEIGTQDSRRQCGIFCAEKCGITQGLVDQNQMRKR